MDDLKLARRRLIEGGLNLLAIKDGIVIFEGRSPGIRDLLYAIENIGEDLTGAALADRIVGRAAALLCAYAGIASVFAKVISKGGVSVLVENDIPCLFEENVINISNADGSDVCPFEKLVSGVRDPSLAYGEIVKSIKKQEKSG